MNSSLSDVPTKYFYGRLSMMRISQLIFPFFAIIIYPNRIHGDDFDPSFSIDRPSALTQCVPVNITWSGGFPPYSLSVNLRDSSQVFRQFDGINATQLLWATDLPAGTMVSLHIIDRLNVLQSVLDPITIGAGPNTTCLDGITPITTTGPQVPTASIKTQEPLSQNSLRGGEIAGIVLGLITSLLLISFGLWRYYREKRRRAELQGNQPTDALSSIRSESIFEIGHDNEETENSQAGMVSALWDPSVDGLHS